MAIRRQLGKGFGRARAGSTPKRVRVQLLGNRKIVGLWAPETRTLCGEFPMPANAGIPLLLARSFSLPEGALCRAFDYYAWDST